MKTYHLLTLFVALGLMVGCGASATSSQRAAAATQPATAYDQAELPDVSWQAGLSRSELGKVALPLWRWLDGDSTEDLGLLEDDGETVHVTIRLRHELYEDEVAHYQRLGLAATQGESAPSGRVTRAQLLELARDHNVLELSGPREAVEPSAEPATATAQADTGAEPTAM